MQIITPFLWFDGVAEEAVNFYVSIFKNSKVKSLNRIGKGGHLPSGTVMSATFQLEGQDFYALNGGPMFKFSPAISFFVSCKTQAEVDRLTSEYLMLALSIKIILLRYLILCFFRNVYGHNYLLKIFERSQYFVFMKVWVFNVNELIFNKVG